MMKRLHSLINVTVFIGCGGCISRYRSAITQSCKDIELYALVYNANRYILNYPYVIK